MLVTVLSVSKPKDRPCLELHDRYVARLAKLGLTYQSRFVPETAMGSQYSDAHIQEREAQALRKQRSGRGVTIALDPRGKSFTSESIAEKLESWCRPEATFLIGGPLGLHPELRRECDVCWSLSSLTFPHELARVLLVEQLYRGMTLLRGLPYHK